MFYFHFCLFAYHVDSFTACAYAFITMCDMACGGAADELHRTELHVENDTTVWSSVLQCGVQPSVSIWSVDVKKNIFFLNK